MLFQSGSLLLGLNMCLKCLCTIIKNISKSKFAKFAKDNLMHFDYPSNVLRFEIFQAKGQDVIGHKYLLQSDSRIAQQLEYLVQD